MAVCALTAFATNVLVLFARTLIVPSAVILIPLPILTPPNIVFVAVCREYGPVVTLIVPSAEVESPLPILTPPNNKLVAVCRANDPVVTLIVPLMSIPIPLPILTPPNTALDATCMFTPFVELIEPVA